MSARSSSSSSIGVCLLIGAAWLAWGVQQACAVGGPLPDFVNWSYEGAWQRDNGPRAEICLNGWWRWQVGIAR